MSTDTSNTRSARFRLAMIVGGVCAVGEAADILFNLIDLASLALAITGGSGVCG